MGICNINFKISDISSFFNLALSFILFIVTLDMKKITQKQVKIAHDQSKDNKKIACDQFEKNKQYFSFNIIAITLNAFSTNKDLQKIFYDKFEYDTDKQFVYDSKTFPGSQEERKIDALLRTLAIPAVACKHGLIDPNDLFLLEYYICRVVENIELKKYLNDHEKWLKKEGIVEHPFLSLRWLSGYLIRRNPKLLERSRPIPDFFIKEGISPNR